MKTNKMKTKDLIKLSIRMFKARTSRTLLTILGMSIGIAAILFLVSLGYGLQRTLLEKITTSEALLTLDVFNPKGSGVVLDNKSLQEISQLKGVDSISSAFKISAQENDGELASDVDVYGANYSFLKLEGFQIVEGNLLSDENKEGVVISSAVAQISGKAPKEMIDKEITFTYFIKQADGEADLVINSEKKYKVVGVVEGTKPFAYINADFLKEEIVFDKFDQLKVKCKSSDIMDTVRGQIIEKGFDVSSVSDTVSQANQVFSFIKGVLTLFGLIALVVSAIGMFNTMTIALLERTEEIGIMKSIGASDRSISMMFIMEAAVMGFLGGILGVLLGLISGELFNFLINFVAVRFGGEKVDMFYSPLWFIFFVVAFAGLVGVITGIIPARRASGIDPLDALRYK